MENRPRQPVDYDRGLYGSWADLDGDCQNERHEVLETLSTGQVVMSADGCYVLRGRWNDPYTGKIFFESSDLDIDHMVPLAYAHVRGGDRWTSAMRKKFANDHVNLFAVSSSENRSKGARGPLEWMPSNQRFHCMYVTRFHRVMLMYDLDYLPGEGERMDALRAQVCN